MTCLRRGPSARATIALRLGARLAARLLIHPAPPVPCACQTEKFDFCFVDGTPKESLAYLLAAEVCFLSCSGPQPDHGMGGRSSSLCVCH